MPIESETAPPKQRKANLTESTWEEFAEAGLFWWINRSLHLFGWVLVREMTNDSPPKVSRVYPARCRYRGFTSTVEEDGFIRLTEHLSQNMPALVEQVKE